MIQKIKFKVGFDVNFSAFVIYLFEKFPGCTKDALSKINRLELKKDIEKIKRKETLEDDENFLRELQKNPLVLKKKIPLSLFNQIYSNYKKYYTKNNQIFQERAKGIMFRLNNKKINKILKSIEDKTGVPFKAKDIPVWLVDVYYLKHENNIEGTTTKEGIYLGLPSKPTNLFYSVLIHELIHYNIQGKYSESKEEVIAQILGIEISKRVLGRTPLQTMENAKKRIKKITKKEFSELHNIWKNSGSIGGFLKAIPV